MLKVLFSPPGGEQTYRIQCQAFHRGDTVCQAKGKRTRYSNDYLSGRSFDFNLWKKLRSGSDFRLQARLR